jgi:hypothetical protein
LHLENDGNLVLSEAPVDFEGRMLGFSLVRGRWESAAEMRRAKPRSLFEVAVLSAAVFAILS